MKKLIYLSILFLTNCLASPESPSPYMDSTGEIEFQQVFIKVSYGTLKADNNLLVSNIQTPNVQIYLHSLNANPVDLNFLFNNMRANYIPVLQPARGIISQSGNPKSYYYFIQINPGEELTINLISFNATSAYNFGVVGDIQSNNTIGELIAASASIHNLDFFIITGDYVSQATETEYQWAYLFSENNFSMPVYTIMGNHDASIGGNGYYLFGQYFGRTNFEFSHNEDLFLFLDSSQHNISESVYGFAQLSLSENRRNKFIFMHIPPFDQDGVRANGFSSDFQAARFINMVKNNNGDIIFSGHIHTYQDFFVSNIRTIVIGTGGGLPMRFDGVGFQYLITHVDSAGNASIEIIPIAAN